MSKIPEEWENAQIIYLCNLINGRAFKPSEWSKKGLPIIRIQNLNNSNSTYNYFNGELDNKHLIQKGDLLFAWSGTPGTSFGAHTWMGPKAALNQHIFKIDYNRDLINDSYFRYSINNKLQELIGNAQGGVGLRHITKKTFEKTAVFFPSLPEQNEIASRLERLLGQVDGIKKRMDGIPVILKSFRQSVLSTAVNGKLTEEWRGENQFNTIKNIRVLNIAERKKMQKYKQPKKLESKIHFILDSTWQLISMDEACIKITDGTHHSPKSFSEGDYMYVTSKNVREGYIDLKKITYVDTTTHIEIYSRCDVIKGDVLFVKDGANTGLACVNNIEEEISLLSSVGVLRTTSYVVPKFLEFYLNSPFTRRIMYSMMGGTAIKRLTLTKIMSLPFPLPPLEEQKEIVKRVESSFALADALELKIKEAQKRVDHLTQSILAKAFYGDLTKEWRELHRDLITGDNSAFALMERIKEERETLKVTKTGKKPLKKKDDKVLVAAENGGRYG